jgi:hypothetical protein
MKLEDKETLETIKRWSGHSDRRLERNVLMMILALGLSAIVSAVVILYFILCILFSAWQS